MIRLIRQAVLIAAAVALVVVPLSYAIGAGALDTWMAAGCGLAIGVGVGSRGRSESGPWTGILTGSMVGVFTAFMAGGLPYNGPGWLLPPILALAVGLIDGQSPLSGYRDVIRETFIVSLLLASGLSLAWLALGESRWGPGFRSVAFVLSLTPWTALLAGLLSLRRDAWRAPPRPPHLLLLGAALLPPLLALGLLDEGVPIARVAWILPLMLVGLPAAAFLLGRAAIVWLEPRLRVYSHLTDYLRVMWVPIGGFAVGYLILIVLFAGFYGMLEHFSPGAFAGAGSGIIEWLSFAFFAALGQDFATVTPVSVGARALVGVHLILSAGWVVVLFAAVMSSIGPKLDRIARRNPQGDD